MDYREFHFEVKSVDAAGKFEGYAAVYGNKDRQSDVIEPHAFTDWLKENAGRGVPILQSHDTRTVVGYCVDLQEDKYGLRVNGEFSNTAAGRDMAEQVKHALSLGHQPGLSIGYGPRGEDSFRYVGNTRHLKRLNVYEFSVTPTPANELARIRAVKSGDESEGDLRKKFRAAGLSREQADIAIAAIKAEAPGESKESGETLRAKVRREFKESQIIEEKQRKFVIEVMAGKLWERAKQQVDRRPYERNVSREEAIADWERRRKAEYESHARDLSPDLAEQFTNRQFPAYRRPKAGHLDWDEVAYNGEIQKRYDADIEHIMAQLKACGDSDDIVEVLDGLGWKEWQIAEFKTEASVCNSDDWVRDEVERK